MGVAGDLDLMKQRQFSRFRTRSSPVGYCGISRLAAGPTSLRSRRSATQPSSAPEGASQSIRRSCGRSWPMSVRLLLMTVREYFEARSRRARRFLSLGFVLAAVSVLLFAAIPNLGVAYCYVLATVGAVGVGLVLGALLYLDRTKCPACRGRLGIQIANQYRFGRRFGFCPFCGVGFDKCEVRS